MLAPTGADQTTTHQETQATNTRLMPEVPGTAVQPEATFSEDHSRSPTYHSWFEMLEAPRTVMQPEVIFSEDQYTSSTYHKWFERHTGLSLDEAIALGLAAREQTSKWKTVRSPDGLWHLIFVNTV